MNKHWYKNCTDLIKKLYGDDWELFCDILAALSPRQQIKRNWSLAVQVYDSHKQGDINYQGCMPCHVKNIQRAINREPLSGQKVSAFASNLKGDLSKVTVDMWMCKLFNIKTLNKKLYQEVSDCITHTADLISWQPAELQAVLWCEIVKKHGRRPKSYCDCIDKQMLLFGRLI